MFNFKSFFKTYQNNFKFYFMRKMKSDIIDNENNQERPIFYYFVESSSDDKDGEIIIDVREGTLSSETKIEERENLDFEDLIIDVTDKTFSESDEVKEEEETDEDENIDRRFIINVLSRSISTDVSITEFSFDSERQKYPYSIETLIEKKYRKSKKQN